MTHTPQHTISPARSTRSDQWPPTTGQPVQCDECDAVVLHQTGRPVTLQAALRDFSEQIVRARESLRSQIGVDPAGSISRDSAPVFDRHVPYRQWNTGGTVLGPNPGGTVLGPNPGRSTDEQADPSPDEQVTSATQDMDGRMFDRLGGFGDEETSDAEDTLLRLVQRLREEVGATAGVDWNITVTVERRG